jgi:hypothetical protein
MSFTPGCEVRLNCPEQKIGDFPTSITYSHHLALPEVFKSRDIQLAQRDCEILGRILQSRSEDMLALLESVGKNKITDANQIASKLGLSEEEFARQGGGWFFLLVILVICIIAAGAAHEK